jgi:Tfp pilus assembly protein PilF
VVYREAIHFDPSQAAIYNDPGIVLCYLQQYREAEKAYREAVRLDSGYKEARDNLKAVRKRKRGTVFSTGYTIR